MSINWHLAVSVSAIMQPLSATYRKNALLAVCQYQHIAEGFSHFGNLTQTYRFGRSNDSHELT